MIIIPNVLYKLLLNYIKWYVANAIKNIWLFKKYCSVPKITALIWKVYNEYT